MPRANRYIIPGQIYHVTHRCHNKSFLFKFGRDRDAYRAMLRDRLQHFPISVLGYCITSDHTHLLLKVNGNDVEALGRFMQTLEGDFAQAYNLRKKRVGAFWSDRYHAVMVEHGTYLWRCLRYIDLNMVRAGVVRSPADWDWCGYQEISGLRSRFRVVDRKALAEALAPARPFLETAKSYLETVDDALRSENHRREGFWTESLAVGSENFVREIGSMINGRMAIETKQEGGVWLALESGAAYSLFSAPKKGSKP